MEKYLGACLDKYNKRAMEYVLVQVDEQNHGNFDKERTQRTVLATWLLEIKLNMLEEVQNQALLKKDRGLQEIIDKKE